MKLASFNVENLFLRARALDGPTFADGASAIAQQKRLNQVLEKPRYAARDRRTIVELLKALGLDKHDDGGPFALLRQNRSKLVKRSKAGVEVVAGGRGDWIGWVDLKTEEVNDVATRMT